MALTLSLKVRYWSGGVAHHMYWQLNYEILTSSSLTDPFWAPALSWWGPLSVSHAMKTAGGTSWKLGNWRCDETACPFHCLLRSLQWSNVLNSWQDFQFVVYDKDRNFFLAMCEIKTILAVSNLLLEKRAFGFTRPLLPSLWIWSRLSNFIGLDDEDGEIYENQYGA